MHIISESVLMLFTENYQNKSVLVETTTCQKWLVFWDTLYSLHTTAQYREYYDVTDRNSDISQAEMQETSFSLSWPSDPVCRVTSLILIIIIIIITY